MNWLFRNHGKILLATLSTEMLDCNESFSVPCWTREEATLYLQDKSGRGHGRLSKQAVTISQWMNFHLAEPYGLEPGPDFSTTITQTTKSPLLPEILDQNFTWKQLKHILKTWWLLFYVFSPLHVWFLPEEMQLWTRGLKCRSQNPAQLCWGCSDILSMIPTNIQGLDSKGSGTQLSTIHARIPLSSWSCSYMSAGIS